MMTQRQKHDTAVKDILSKLQIREQEIKVWECMELQDIIVINAYVSYFVVSMNILDCSSSILDILIDVLLLCMYYTVVSPPL